MLFSITMMLICTVIPLVHIAVALWPKKEKEKMAFVNDRHAFSLLIPCYNEAGILLTTIKGLQQFSNYETQVILINDGSTDHTMAWLTKHLELALLEEYRIARIHHKPIRGVYQSMLLENVIVIDKQNGGKADSLNAGLTYCAHDLVVTLDADSILQKDALQHCSNAFQQADVVAGGGTVKILQGSTKFHKKNTSPLNILVQSQIMEYIKGFFILKSSLSRMNAMLVISGAFGVFRKSLLEELDGFRQTIGEDIDLTIRIQQYLMKHPEKKMICIPDAICYTECPETWGDVFKQRIRWQKAFVDSVIKYHQFLLAHCFRRSFAFFVIMDAIIAGTFSTYFTMVAILTALLWPGANQAWLLTYVVLSTITTFVYNILAIHQSKKGTAYTLAECKQFLSVILLDLVFWRYMNFLFIILGTILYFFNQSDWNKVARSNHEYSV